MENARLNRGASRSSAAALPGWRLRIGWWNWIRRANYAVGGLGRLGGVLSTVDEDGFQVEHSADNFITTIPWGVNLCKRLGLADQLIQTNPAYRRTFVVRRGRLYRLPDGFLMMAPTRLWPLAVTPILESAGQAPRGDGILHSAAKGRRRREHGRVRPPPAWAAKSSTGWSSRWSARSTPPTWKSSACWPRCPASAKWSGSTAA